MTRSGGNAMHGLRGVLRDLGAVLGHGDRVDLEREGVGCSNLIRHCQSAANGLQPKARKSLNYLISLVSPEGIEPSTL